MRADLCQFRKGAGSRPESGWRARETVETYSALFDYPPAEAVASMTDGEGQLSFTGFKGGYILPLNGEKLKLSLDQDRNDTLTVRRRLHKEKKRYENL